MSRARVRWDKVRQAAFGVLVMAGVLLYVVLGARVVLMMF